MGVRPRRTARSGGGSPRGWSTGCGSTTPTACATRAAYLDDLARADRRRLRGGREDPRARRGAADVVGDRRHDRVRRPRARSTGCSSTPPARHRSTPSSRGCAEARSPGPTSPTTPSGRWPTGRCWPRYAGSSRRASASLVEAGRQRGLEPPTRSRTPSPRSSRTSPSTAPTSPRAASTSTQALRRRAAAPSRPGSGLRRARAGAHRPERTPRRCGSSRPAGW